MSLPAESTADVCVLRLTYLKELSEPVLTPYHFNTFGNWCPTKREMSGRAHAKGARRGRGSPHGLLSDRAAPPTSLTTGPLACMPDKMRQPRWDSLSSRGTCSAYSSHTTSLLSATPARSSPRCPSAPRTASLLRISAAYLALPSLVGLYQQRRMMTWFLKRWNRISDGLLDAEPDAATAPSSLSSSPPMSRHDMLVLKRADPFGLLARDEQEEDELDFRAALMDPEECRGYL
jgi:hypothetical protein